MKLITSYILIASLVVAPITPSFAAESMAIERMIEHQQQARWKEYNEQLASEPYIANFLKEYKVFILAQIKVSKVSVAEARKCFNNASEAIYHSEKCKERRDYAYNKIVPAFKEMRLYASLINAEDDGRAQDHRLSEAPFLFDHVPAKISSQPNHNFRRFHNDFFGELPKVPQIQSLSFDELQSALLLYEAKGLEYANAYVAANGSLADLQNAKIYENPARQHMSARVNNRAANFLAEDYVLALHRHINKMRRFEMRKHFTEKYISTINKHPIIAYMTMPLSNEPNVNKKDQLRSCLTKAANASATAGLADLDTRLDNPLSKRIFDERARRCQKLVSELPVYELEAKHFEQTLADAYSILYQIQETLDRTLASWDLENNRKEMMNLVGWQPALKHFTENENQKDELVAPSQTVTYGQLGLELFEKFETREMISDLTYGAGVMTAVVACMAVGSKAKAFIEGAKAALKVMATGLWAGFCTFLPSYGADSFFMHLTESRYQSDYNALFTSDGSTLVLQDIAKLKSRDQDILLEYIFTGGFTLLPAGFKAAKHLFKKLRPQSQALINETMETVL